MERTMKQSSRNGISIVEVLMALVLLGMAVPMVAGFSTTSKKIQVASNEIENATAAAQSVIDSLSLLPAAIIQAGSPKSASIEGTFRTYQATWTYAPVGSHAGVVKVTVGWTQAGKAHSIQVASEVP
jgi:Tfp pilus assembly protein PilV